ELILFKTGEGKPLQGISSQNQYVFNLSEYSGNELISKVDALLGLKKEEKPTKE
ncbi:MAG: hypothetical protein GY729_17270, partial [Desulfobacteraceae bacterium]|nr:hypothetical protein [Desulfobacteraceae bacterium]